MRVPRLALLVALAAGLAVAALARQRDDAFQVSRDHPAIAYTDGAVADGVAALNERLAAGTARLDFAGGKRGYLEAVLHALDVPVESQVLVFSQTSLQAPLISFHNPRAIYFNDNVAVGWVRGSDTLEIASQDPRQGTMFYQLPQEGGGQPRFEREQKCLQCHLSWDTRAVPGPLVQTVFPRKSDDEYANGFVVDDRVPLAERWGGWWVTGTAVPARHMGNARMIRPDADERGGPGPAKLTSLEGRFDLDGYLTPYSDVVALLVLDHQTHLANLLTRAGWEWRLADYESRLPGTPRGASTAITPRVRQAVDELVDYMLFVEEAPLPSPVRGSSGFAEAFTARGPKDAQGRSLRDFDLERRMMRYPLSYMIYSTGFDGLPSAVKDAVYERLWTVLSGQDASERYAHLTRPTRQAIVEILRATKPDLPDYFGAVTH
ncbi:MAG: hypothetical protein AB7H88_21510 [Vicinamibacterales bacterium]